jgi:hypothetical protein
MLARGQCVVGKRRWLHGLIERLLAHLGGKTCPRQQLLVRFLLTDRLFLRAAERWDDDVPLGLPPPEEHRPLPAFAGLALPAWPNVEALAAWLGVTSQELAWFADRRHLSRTPQAEPLQHYRYRWIRKRGGAPRLIESPKPRLKALQRRILHELLDLLPLHAAAHGFRRGHNILSGAAPHFGQTVVLRMDLSDFFPSIIVARVRGIFAALGYSYEVADCLTGLCTTWTPQVVLDAFPNPEDYSLRMRVEALYRKPHLPQGAPTSPALANLCAFRLDARLAGLAQAAGGRYTRYADDLLFSGGPELVRAAKRFIVQAGAIALEENFAVNFRKTRVMRRGVRQRALGLVINERINVPRADYDLLKAVLCNCVRHGPASQNREQVADFRAHLAGRVGFVALVNPARGERLRRLLDRIVWC